MAEVDKGTKKICAYLPTGGGKSVVIGKIANEGLKGRTLILTHRTEIFKQNAEWLSKVGVLSASENTLRMDNKVVIAMVQTLDARIKNYGVNYIGQFDNIILDEVHILIFEKVFVRYNYKTLIGFTGSPVIYGKKLEFSIDGVEYVEDYTLSKLFDTLVCGPDTQDLIDLGYLVTDQNIVLKLPDFDKLKESANNPDGYTSKSMNEVYYNTVSLDKLWEGYQKYGKGKKCMIFNSSNKVNKMVGDFFELKGINSMVFDTSSNRKINLNTGKKYKREEVVEWFKNERNAVLINTNVFTTGFNVQDVEVIFVNRATKSLALWIQMVGRGSRTTDKIFKDKFLVVDLGQNIYEHGLWSKRRDWNKHFYGPGPRLKKNIDMLSIWECEACGYYNPKGSLSCEYCGEEKKPTTINGKKKLYKEGEFESYNEIKPPSGKKIVKYCKDKDLKVGDAFKLVTNNIIDLFVYHEVSQEFYKEKREKFDQRVLEIFRPCYFAVLDKRNGLKGNRRRKLTTEYNRLLTKIKDTMNYDD
jgi:superfamily II DNA or RNA helicase